MQDPREQEPLIMQSRFFGAGRTPSCRGPFFAGTPRACGDSGKKLRAQAGPLVKCVPYVNAGTS